MLLLTILSNSSALVIAGIWLAIFFGPLNLQALELSWNMFDSTGALTVVYPVVAITSLICSIVAWRIDLKVAAILIPLFPPALLAWLLGRMLS